MGYLNYQKNIDYNPKDSINYYSLREAMKTQGNGITYPWDIDNGIKEFATGYKVESCLYGPGAAKNSLRDNIPGISLRGTRLGALEWHYRNVVGFRIVKDQFLFWTIDRCEMLIHDQNDVDHGRWERFNPAYQFVYYRTMKK